MCSSFPHKSEQILFSVFRLCLDFYGKLLYIVGWLVGCFWAWRPFETVFQSISGRLPKRGRERRERIDESKNVQTTPPAPTARAVGPCPTLIQTSRTPRHWKFTQDHRTTRPPPTIHCRKTLRCMVTRNNEEVCAIYCIIFE